MKDKLIGLANSNVDNISNPLIRKAVKILIALVVFVTASKNKADLTDTEFKKTKK